MPRRSPLPTYGFHKATGQARCYVKGRSVYLGPYGSEESRIRFAEVVSKLAGGQKIDPLSHKSNVPNDPGPSVAELVLAFEAHANNYYLKPDGTHTDEIHCLQSAIKPVRELFGLIPVKDFTPLMLKAAREKYIENAWTRGFCNRSTNRVRSMFKWGVENGIVPVEIWQALTAISPLKSGRCEAHDNDKREAVADEHLEAVRLRLKQRNRDILDLLLLTAARIGELLSVTWSMVDKSDEIWVVVLENHKMAYRGKTRKLHFGKRAQEILKRYEHIPADSLLRKKGGVNSIHDSDLIATDDDSINKSAEDLATGIEIGIAEPRIDCFGKAVQTSEGFADAGMFSRL